MAQPAARIGDQGLHKGGAPGGVLSGSADVRIGGASAARKGDAVQHGKGKEAIIEGEPTVRINGRLAARLGDALSCDGVIIQGCASVRIGLHPQGACLQRAAQSGAALVQERSE
jgi:uncharacterized Zn-binding protein involved in type VI secretion